MQLAGLQIRSMGEYDVVELLHEARATFAEIKDALNVALCADKLSMGYSQRDDFEQARKWAMTAMREYDRIGWYEHASGISALAHSNNGDYDSALKLLMQALERSKSTGARRGVGTLSKEREDPRLKPVEEDWRALARWFPADIKELVSDDDERDHDLQLEAAQEGNESDG
ncbi:hypothetical protein LshimejAT787_1203720 [Lyophyllum shimeji]|uniref:Uncharacterized protein n=1 Tax=Lyophyllum shimeji TaxID=47721 RepID=A0A9P3URR5_LYOSH|nr:hypothetical protein LshimejAT787_1203720 [Lyophyllum shimeji]